MSDIPTYWAFCCRWWEVAVGSRLSRCGYCGQRPESRPWAETPENG